MNPGDVKEVDIWLNQYDMDHLQDGAPVYKAAGENRLVVLRFGEGANAEP